MPLDKRALVQAIVAQLAGELETYARSARATHEEATHEQSKAENKYDTRGLEASYLAQGQSRQAAEVVLAAGQFEALEPAEFGKDDPIDLGALVELESGRDRLFYFMGPRAGGIEVLHEGMQIVVITPQSPMGRELLGRKKGERFEFGQGKSQTPYRIRNVR
jgi:transcription elongation GreA/GreB family factor